MVKPKQLSDIMMNLEKKTLRKLINRLYYNRGKISFKEAEIQLNGLSYSSKSLMLNMLLEDWEKRHPFPKDPKKQRNWDNCYDIILANLSYELLGEVFN